jgi:hypothetical protein
VKRLDTLERRPSRYLLFRLLQNPKTHSLKNEERPSGGFTRTAGPSSSASNHPIDWSWIAGLKANSATNTLPLVDNDGVGRIRWFNWVARLSLGA